MLADWLAVATSIWAAGYEGHRESIELKPLDPNLAGSPMQLASLEATKGCRRLSVLLFTLFWTYLEIRNSLEADDKADLQRTLGGRVCRVCGIKPSSFGDLTSRT